MKQFILLVGVVTLGCIGSLYSPVWGLMVYYALAVLRPQYLWDWALPVEWRWSLFAALAITVGLVINLTKLIPRMRLSPMFVLLLLYGALLILSALQAYDTQIAQHWLIEAGKVLYVCIVASLILTKLWEFRSVALIILICLGYIAWEINTTYLFKHRLDVYHYGFGGLDNNGAGLMLAMGIPVAYAYGMSAPRLWQRGLAWFLGLVLIHAVMMTYSRGAMLSAAIGGIWLIIHHRSMPQRIIIIAALAVAIPILAGPEIRDRFMSIQDYQTDESAQSRLASWQAALEMANEYPLGKGIRNSNKFSYNYGADMQGRTIHSQYLQIAADSGLITMCVYVAMILLALYNFRLGRIRCLRFVRRIRQSDSNDPDSDLSSTYLTQTAQISLGLETSLIVFAFGGLFLSLEVFELPWILITLGGVMPRVVNEHLNTMRTTIGENQALPEPELASPRKAGLSLAWPGVLAPSR